MVSRGQKFLERFYIGFVFFLLYAPILILIIGGLNLLLLGLVGEYVGRVFMCVNATPQYVEREVYKQ